MSTTSSARARPRADPEVSLPVHGGETEAFALLRSVVADLQAKGQVANLSGLKNKVRKVQPGFSEKTFGYGGFLQFAKAAATQGVISLEWDLEDGDQVLGAPKGWPCARAIAPQVLSCVSGRAT